MTSNTHVLRALPGHRVEIVDPKLSEGELVDVVTTTPAGRKRLRRVAVLGQLSAGTTGRAGRLRLARNSLYHDT